MKLDLYDSIKPIIDYNLSIRVKILEICNPLFNNFDITYFEYAKIFDDGRIFYICTNKDWLRFSLENKMFDDEEHIRLCSIAKAQNSRYALWNTLKLEKTNLLSNYFRHDVWNGLTINEIDEDSFNAYSLATTKNNVHLNDFFMNNLSLFDHFIFYFKQKLRLVLDMDAEKLTFNASPLKDISGPDNLDQYNHKINKFLEQTALQQIAIKINNNIAYLTKRELQCLRMIPMGRTLKEIGNQLEISQRTVETHINAIKSKTGLVFKNELISLYEKSSLNLYRNF